MKLRPDGASLHSLTITEYQRRYRRDVRELLFSSYRTHTHLDWQNTDQWLDSADSPMRLAWAGSRLVGFMGTSAPLNGTCWIRLAAVSDEIQPQPVLDALWNDLQGFLETLSIHTVALLGLRDWIIRYLPGIGFHYVEDIVTLRRNGAPLTDPKPASVTLHRAEEADLEAIAAVDQAAFSAPWQLSTGELRQAMRVAADCMVAIRGQVIVGYQLSTLYFDGAHLARLAVAPSEQHLGVGRALVDDLLRRLSRRGIHSMTVNTQASNERSQRLYQQFGFERNGHDLPVWMAAL